MEEESREILDGYKENYQIKFQSIHLAGIIPTISYPLDFDMDWDDCLIPVAPDFTAVERSVLECAYAGCETIWVICLDSMIPLIKYRLGEWIKDPIYIKERRGAAENEKRIPLFYVPLHLKDRKKRSISFGILHGVVSAYWICRKISRWTTPDRFYVSFPFGIYRSDVVREYRKMISNQKLFFLSYENKTVLNGEYLGFSFSAKEYILYKRNFNKLRHEVYTKHKERKFNGDEEFSIEKIFGCVNIEEDNSVVSKIDWYYKIDSWDGYCNYLSSEHRKEIYMPKEDVFKGTRKWLKLGEDEEDE